MHCREYGPPNDFSYAFLDHDGLPYIYAEKVDRNYFRQVDRSLIQNNIFIDTKEAMRAIVDISIDDIGKLSNGNLNVLGNMTKQKSLYKMIARNYNILDHHLDVIRKGIVVRINYKLENNRTGQTLRSVVETLRIPNRDYYLDINGSNIDDCAIITNFFDSIVSTMNHFTHGYDTMILRITNIQLFYECVRPKNIPCHYDSYVFHDMPISDYDLYRYHNDRNRPVGHHHNDIIPGRWSLFNRFYHFDEMSQEIIFHENDIYDKGTETIMIPCGFVPVNRAFTINPGHRIIFKLSIWKNDLTLVNNLTRIRDLLQIPILNRPEDHYPIHHPKPDPEINNQNKLIMDITKQQNDTINKLIKVVNELNSTVKSEEEEIEDIPELPDIPEKPEKPRPPKPNHHHCHCNNNNGGNNSNYVPIDAETIANIVKDASTILESEDETLI